MNIKEATKHIKNTITVYLEKDETGDYCIPVAKQRPIFLFGPPGIGKTAVMEQIAEELGIGLVSYSMTHHTRQSAIGLPFITKKKFGNKEIDVSEYTMSEILASVYEYIEQSGKNEGILFLDEINCVSETLAPSMLRFLQYKTFGSHAVPKGWVVVTAGNPPEYNRSVKPYDIATLDRIKKIEIEADYSVWREYALNQKVHPAIIAYLDVKPKDFYIIENTPAGKCFVTARGWEDLSRIMLLFEKNNLSIDISLVEQYLQNPEVSENFTDYYNTYLSLGEIFKPEEILNGNASAILKEKVKNASVSEKLGFLNLLTNRLFYICEQPNLKYKLLKEASMILRDENVLISNIETAISLIDDILFSFAKKENDDSIYQYESKKAKIEKHLLYQMFLKIKSLLCNPDSDTKTIVSTYLKSETEHLTNLISETQAYLSNATDFIYEVFGNSPEKQIFVSDMTLNKYSAEFLMSFGCERFESLSDRSEYEKKIAEELQEI